MTTETTTIAILPNAAQTNWDSVHDVRIYDEDGHISISIEGTPFDQRLSGLDSYNLKCVCLDYGQNWQCSNFIDVLCAARAVVVEHLGASASADDMLGVIEQASEELLHSVDIGTGALATQMERKAYRARLAVARCRHEDGRPSFADWRALAAFLATIPDLHAVRLLEIARNVDANDRREHDEALIELEGGE